MAWHHGGKQRQLSVATARRHQHSAATHRVAIIAGSKHHKQRQRAAPRAA